MKEKNLVILCIIFAILLGLIFFKQSVKPQVPTTEETSNIIQPSVRAEEVNEMILRIGEGDAGAEDKPKTVHMAKEGDHWVVKTEFGIYASENTITSLLEKLDQLQGELRSNKSDVLEDYGITDDQGIHVELQRQDGNKVHMVIGTIKAGYQNNFVRLASTSAVYVVEENLLGSLGVREDGDERSLNAGRWTDKRITHLKAGDVTGITISQIDESSEKTVINVTREMVDDKKQWISAIPYEFGLSASKIKSVIEGFNGTYAQKVIAPDIEGVFDAPGWTGVFTLDDGDQVKLIRGAKDEEEKNYYLKQEGAGYVYLIATSTFDSRVNRQGGIFASNPLKVENNNVSELEVRSLDDDKEFYVVKKAPQETEEAEEAQADGDDAEKSTDDQSETPEDLWQAANGEAVETQKVEEIIGKIKGINLEAVLKPAASIKDAVILRIVKDGESKEYRISASTKTSTNKECQFLKLGETAQSYCATPSAITALLNSLP